MDPTDHSNIDRRSDGRSEPGPEMMPPGDMEPEGPRRRGNRHHTSRRRKRSRQAGAEQEQELTAAEAPTRGNPSRMNAAMASGRTPGVRAADDPGAAPLGTDDEAAGTPPTPAAVDYETARAEQGRGRQGLTAEQAMSGRPGHPEESPRAWGKFVTIAAVVVIAIVVVGIAML